MTDANTWVKALPVRMRKERRHVHATAHGKARLSGCKWHSKALDLQKSDHQRKSVSAMCCSMFYPVHTWSPNEMPQQRQLLF